MWHYIIVTLFFVIVIRQNLVTGSDLTPQHPDDHCSSRCNNVNQSSKGPSCSKHSATFSNLILKPIDCEELLRLGYTKSGVYYIWPRNKIMDGKSLRVFCDMDTDNGGWTVLQRRGNFLRPKDYFYKDWESYKRGFGDIEKDFWLGNDNIFALTNQRAYSVRFDLIDVEGTHLYAMYDIFYIGNEENQYKLTIQDYSGTANDSMIEGGHNDQKFTTKDVDNDKHENNCAVLFKGAWWYNSCHASNLNGLYLRGKHESFADGVNWSKWKGYNESLERVAIKIRPRNFQKNVH